MANDYASYFPTQKRTYAEASTSSIPSLQDLLAIPTSKPADKSSASTASSTLSADDPSFSTGITDHDSLTTYPTLKSAKAAFARFAQEDASPTAEEYFGLLQAFVAHRQPDTPLKDILVTYNQMLARDMKPTPDIVGLVMSALCVRDEEVYRKTVATSNTDVNVPRVAPTPPSRTPLPDTRPQRKFQKPTPINPYDREHYPSAISLWNVCQGVRPAIAIPRSGLLALLHAAGRRKDANTIEQVSAELESRSRSKGERCEYGVFEGTIAALGGSNSQAIRAKFLEFLELEAQGAIQPNSNRLGSSQLSDVDGPSAVWNATVLALVQVGDVKAAETICEAMVKTHSSLSSETEERGTEEQAKESHSSHSVSTSTLDPSSSSSGSTFVLPSLPSYPIQPSHLVFVQLSSEPTITCTWSTPVPNFRFVQSARSLGLPTESLAAILKPIFAATDRQPEQRQQELEFAQSILGSGNIPATWMWSSIANLLISQEAAQRVGQDSPENRRELIATYLDWVGREQRREVTPLLETAVLEFYGQIGGFERIARWHDSLFTLGAGVPHMEPLHKEDKKSQDSQLPTPSDKFAPGSAASHHHRLLSHLLLPNSNCTLPPVVKLQLILTLVSVGASHGVSTKALALQADAIFYFNSLFRQATKVAKGDFAQILQTVPWAQAAVELALEHDEFRIVKHGRTSSYMLSQLLINLANNRDTLLPGPLNFTDENWIRIAQSIAHHTPSDPASSIQLLEPLVPSSVYTIVLQKALPSSPVINSINFDFSSAPWSSYPKTLAPSSPNGPLPNLPYQARLTSLSNLAALVHEATPFSLAKAYEKFHSLAQYETPIVPSYWLVAQFASAIARQTQSYDRVLELLQFVESSSNFGREWDGSDPVEVHTQFIQAFAACGDYISAQWYFARLVRELKLQPNARMYAALISCAPDPEGDASVAETYWLEASADEDVVPTFNREIYNAMLEAYTNAGQVKKVEKVFQMMKKKQSDSKVVGIEPNWASYAHIMVSAQYTSFLLPLFLSSWPPSPSLPTFIFFFVCLFVSFNQH